MCTGVPDPGERFPAFSYWWEKVWTVGTHVVEVLVPGDQCWRVAKLLRMAMSEHWANVKGYLKDERQPEPPGVHWGEGPVPDVPAA